MKQQVEEQVVSLLKQRAYELCGETPGMGDMEKAIEVAALASQREVLKQMVQETAREVAPQCSCSKRLRIESWNRRRSGNFR